MKKLWLLMCCLLPLEAGAAIAIATSGSNETGWPDGSTNVTVDLTLTAGNSVVVIAQWRGNTASVDVATVSAQNMTSTGAAQYQATGEVSVQIWYLNSISSSGSTTISIGLTAAAGGGIYVYELSGTDNTDVFDAENNASGATGTPSLSLTTANANAAVFAIAAGDFGNGNFSASGTGYTTVTMVNTWGYVDGEYNINVDAAGAKTVAMSAFSSAWVFKAAAFNAASGGTSGLLRRRRN